MKGSRTKLRPNPALKTISVAVTSSSPKTIASSARRPSNRQVGGKAADPHARPEARAGGEQQGERDSRGRQDGARVARRNRHQQRALRGGEVRRREKEDQSALAPAGWDLHPPSLI